MPELRALVEKATVAADLSRSLLAEFQYARDVHADEKASHLNLSGVADAAVIAARWAGASTEEAAEKANVAEEAFYLALQLAKEAHIRVRDCKLRRAIESETATYLGIVARLSAVAGTTPNLNESSLSPIYQLLLLSFRRRHAIFVV